MTAVDVGSEQQRGGRRTAKKHTGKHTSARSEAVFCMQALGLSQGVWTL